MKVLNRRVLRGFLTAALVTATMAVQADNYPNRDITFIVPYGPGGSTDPISRKFVEQLQKTLHASINVENKPGGSATIGSGVVIGAKPDGYTIGLGSNSALTYQPLINSGLAYKSPDDYQAIVKLVDQPAILAVRADAPWKTFEEFMVDVKKNPGKIRASNSGFGTTNDLVTRQLNKVAGVRITPVPFSGGGGEALIALLGNRVEAHIGYGASTQPHARAGKVRVLAVFKKGPYDLFPDATPIGDTYDATLPAMYSVIAPKGLPKEVLDKLVNASLLAVKTPEFIAFAKSNGYVVDAKGPDAVKAELVNYTATFAELLKESEKK